MRGFFALYRKELRGDFGSPVAALYAARGMAAEAAAWEERAGQ